MAGGGSGRDHLAILCTEVRRILLGLDTYDEAMVRLAAAGALDRGLDRKEEATLAALIEGLDGDSAEQVEQEYRDSLDLVDPRNGLILIPARTIRALLDHDGKGPTDLEWVALEQVPPAGPVFDAYAQALRELGFSALSVKVNAADYGVPQTRERRFVLASRVRKVTVPEPNHADGGEAGPCSAWSSAVAQHGPRPRMGIDARPYVTVAGGRPGSGGPDPMAVGGTGARQTIATELERAGGSRAPQGVTTTPAVTPPPTPRRRSGATPTTSASSPPTSSSSRGRSPTSARRALDEPAATLAFGNDSARFRFGAPPKRRRRPP